MLDVGVPARRCCLCRHGAALPVGMSLHARTVLFRPLRAGISGTPRRRLGARVRDDLVVLSLA